MNRSEQINELSTALSIAQGEFTPVKRTGRNPHLKNSYVTLDGIIDMVRKPLSENGLSYAQLLSTEESGLPALTTILMHSGGQWISSAVIISVLGGNRGVNELQAFGSSLTYMKRYTLAAMLGVSSDEDDDGNNAPKEKGKSAQATRSPRKRAQKQEPVTQDENTFASAEAAIDWAFDVGKGVFKAKAHAKNAYEKCKKEGSPNDAAEMAVLWRANVVHRLAVKKAGEYPTGPGTHLGDCDLEKLQEHLVWCDEHKGDVRATELGGYVNILIDEMTRRK